MLGIDLATNTGVCEISSSGEVRKLRRVSLAATAKQSAVRLAELSDRLGPHFADRPSLAAIEAPAFHRSGKGSFTAGEYHGCLKLLAARYRVPLVYVAPASLKKFGTGKGKAEKAEMVLACFRRFGVEVKSDDEADAYLLARLGYYLVGLGDVTELIAPQREVITLYARKIESDHTRYGEEEA